MSHEELQHPDAIGSPQIERIAQGAGKPEETVRELLEQHRMMARMMDQFQGAGEGDMERMMKQLQKQGGGGMGGLGGGPFG